MPGKLQNRQLFSRCSFRTLVFTLFLVFTCLFIYHIIFSLTRSSISYSVHTAQSERSFVASLEHFLTYKVSKLSLPVKDDTVRGESDDLVRKLDDKVFERENQLLNEDPAYPVGFPVKVYVYEMPRKFTYDLLWLFHNTYKETSNLTSNGSPVHRLIEQHSIDYWLWADLIAPQSERHLKSVVRVHRQQDADIFYVPFFTTISFFLLEKQQCKALYRGGKVRAKLGAELSSAKDVIVTEGTAGDEGRLAAQKGMRRSLFCLCPAGDTPSSARLFDAIVSGCIPVVVSDELELPFEGLLDYRKIAVFVSSGDATQPGWLVNHLRSLSSLKIKELQKNLAQYSQHFLYSSPAQPLGPEDLTWRMIAGKVVKMKLHTRRSQRMVKGSRSICRCDCWQPNSTMSNSLTHVLS